MTRQQTLDNVAAPAGYVGRFAPSPTGPLHFGSAVAAVASFLQARSQRGRWYVRIDDLDPPREQAGASAAILEMLSALGLEWDGAVSYQSRHTASYATALAQLDRAGATFPCVCTRKQLGGGPYPGNCREGIPPGKVGRSVRVRVGSTEIEFEDQLQGRYRQKLFREVGDFILLRSDGLFSYHLAVVTDDAAAGVTEIVRGVDLLDSTPRQIYLQTLLGVATPHYAHIPVVLNDTGTKLSKQTMAEPLDPGAAPRTLVEALRFLNQGPPAELSLSPAHEVIQWAIEHWDLPAVGGASRAHLPAVHASN